MTAPNAFDRRTRLDTDLIHPGERDAPGAPLVPPPVLSTTFVQREIGAAPAHTYSRASNPTVALLEDALGRLEGLPLATATSSGMAAIATLAFALLKPGGRVLLSRTVYGGTLRLFQRVLEPLGIRIALIDARDLDAAGDALGRARADLLLIETPANPTLQVIDIEALCALGRRHGCPVAVDNTFLTGVLQQPARFGADIVLLSTTKFVEGHNIAPGGAILLRDEALHDKIRLLRKTLGTIQSAHSAWQTCNGIKTLPIRMQRHSENALHVAAAIESHPAVCRVHYPFLPSFPGGEIARRQQLRGGGILSFELDGGLEAARTVLESLRIATPAESLGATETMITHPATMTHGDWTPQMRRAAGISDGLLRLSAGLEDPLDIEDDLAAALDAAASGRARP